MILLNINPQKAKEYEKLIDKTKGKYKSISERLQNWIDANPHNPDVQIARDIKRHLKKILTESPKGIEAIIIQYDQNGHNLRIFNPVDKKLTVFGHELKKIFNYKGFRKSKKAIWLADATQIKSCTVCNSQYTLKTSQVKGEKLLFHFDHYFPQSVYPYLSLSFHNLIPCCASCNMSKSNKPFTLLENINPFLDSFHDIARFKLDKSSLTDFLINPIINEEKIDYKVEIRAKYFGNKIFETKLENYLREFRINEQYLQFKDVAAEIYLKSRYYEKARRKEIRAFFRDSSINVSDELINRFILGNYYVDKDLLRRPLAKFMKAVGEALNLL